ncbi:MAG: serine/threonine-protein kinase, partial [Pirellulaceae bacterium]|nr:serine/threonine-protein kinase [Pirellulaceae bacterium]
PPERAMHFLAQACDSLAEAHARSLVHRDIKPANILITRAGIPKLSDFGLARQAKADHGQTQVGAILGTIDFMPTEQRSDATAVDARSDLWSLAATLYQMVTGKSPKVIRLRDVPSQLQDIISKGLEEAPDERYQSTTEFHDALRASLQSVDSTPLVEVDLGTGECSKCHAKNEASRKFCRGCGKTLLQECLSCKQPMPIWENFCGDCGAGQRELIATRHAELSAQRDKAVILGSEFAFDESLQIAQEIGLIEDSRLQQFKEWSETFIAETTSEKERQELIAAERYAEAMKHHDAFDYPSAIHTLETVPGAMQNVDHSSFLEQLRSDLDESERLITRIKAKLKDRKLDGLLNLVNRAVQLRGDREDLRKLQVNLQDWEERNPSKQETEEGEDLRLVPLPATPQEVRDGTSDNQTLLPSTGNPLSMQGADFETPLGLLAAAAQQDPANRWPIPMADMVDIDNPAWLQRHIRHLKAMDPAYVMEQFAVAGSEHLSVDEWAQAVRDTGAKIKTVFTARNWTALFILLLEDEFYVPFLSW